MVSKEAHKAYFENNKATCYHTGEAKPSRFGFGNLKYFAPYIQGKGIREYYEIISYAISPRDEAYPRDHALYKSDDSSERLILTLGEKRLIKGGQYLTCSITVYRYCKLFNLRNPEGANITVEKVS